MGLGHHPSIQVETDSLADSKAEANLETYQDNINATYATKLKMPVVHNSTLMRVAFGHSAADTALKGQVIPAKQLEGIANK
jgi:heterodisulfide reductase subunit B